MRDLEIRMIGRKVFILCASILLFSTALSAQVVIQRCDVTTGWTGAQSISLDPSDKKEGSASLRSSAASGTSDWFKKSFSSTQTGISSDGYLRFWLFVSDASKLEGGAIEISSSGGSDDKESAWSFDKTTMNNGWNEMKLQISAASETGGGVDLDSVNFFRIYQNVSTAIIIKLDFVRFAPSISKPIWPNLNVEKVDASTLDGKVMFGYQGWFNHPDDGAGLGWVHWGDLYEPIRLSCDLFPDMREFGADELYDSHFTYPDGSMAKVFSSHNQNTVIRHMKWIRDYNLDGVFIQRFISNVDNSKSMDHKDTVAMNVMRGCEKYGGVFAMMYDGVADRVEDMKADWIHMVDDLKLTESDRYLHHRGLPMISLWGYTVRNEATAAQLDEMVDFFTNNPNPKYRASVKVGVSNKWYDKTEFFNAFKQCDVISPWFSGTTDYNYGQKWCDENNVDFLPVVRPGFSWHNMSLDYEDHPTSNELNKTPRHGGRELWGEINHVLGMDCKSLYIAMYDEIDEGTSMFKCAETINDVPVERDWVTLDIDGQNLPSDWYLRVASLSADVVRGYEDNKSSLSNLPTPPKGIMTIRIKDENNGANDGEMEFIFPNFPGATSLDISLDGGSTWDHTTADNAGSYKIQNLNEGDYPVFVRYTGTSDAVDMGTVKITDLVSQPAEAASDPFPADGATDVSLSTVLAWMKGANAVSSLIYYGETANPDYVKYQSGISFNPGSLEPSTTYYWRIDQRNGLGTTQGDVWSFTTGDGSPPRDMVVIDYCDNVGVWKSTNGLELDPADKKEGFASFSCTGSGIGRFQAKLDPIDSYCDLTSKLSLWVYISDVSKFSGGGQIEIGSAGKNDEDEISWSVPDLGLQNGWNELHLPLSSGSKIGNPDLTAINWFRFYQKTSASITVKIDFVRFTDLAYELPNVSAAPKVAKDLSSFTMYPNPASNLCTMELSLEAARKVSVSLCDMTGRELHRFVDGQAWMPGDHTVKLPLSGFSKGAYLIRTEIENVISSKVLLID